MYIQKVTYGAAFQCATVGNKTMRILVDCSTLVASRPRSPLRTHQIAYRIQSFPLHLHHSFFLRPATLFLMLLCCPTHNQRRERGSLRQRPRTKTPDPNEPKLRTGPKSLSVGSIRPIPPPVALRQRAVRKNEPTDWHPAASRFPRARREENA